MLWHCPKCKRVYTDKDLFPEGTEKPKEEKPPAIEVEHGSEPKKAEELPFGKPAVTEKAHAKTKGLNKDSIDNFLAKLLAKSNDWDISILDFIIVGLAIFVMLVLYATLFR